jgi:tRNA 2-selenouridine synthase
VPEGFDTIVDVRSPAEFADDHVPGALNWPVMDDDERRIVGTEYVQVSPFAARKRGAALVARNIARHVEQHVAPLARDWRPLLYCWRGGQRSAAFATVLDQIGFRVQVLEGGYREFRRAVIAELQTMPAQLHWSVLVGRTGSAKTRLLQVLAGAGAQVLDLEALAAHRGSVLGPEPGRAQPSQKAFETALWHTLQGFDPARPVFSEGESRLIGRLRVPEELLSRLRAAHCVELRMPLPARVQFLLHDYAHFVADTEAFCERLGMLRELRGAKVVERWQQLARAGHTAQVVTELLELHYDPGYERSMARHFARFAQAQVVDLADGDEASLSAAAAALTVPAPA